MPVPKKGQWKSVSYRYQELWNIRNCLGSMNGKHIRIQQIFGSGSENIIAKSYHSCVLMTCYDGDGNLL
jgi:hypothetical protein